ncbi:hypothetical protein P170DRAFT_505921 [Aspergillus steynii IBT 23096]|uniref:Nucleotidyltransferase family protein n=1 Tax=Aspergillus steynii IBT 23096 TaxID=1392250 RepID=A0A2I2GR14_9EURO|nr:uncharacterized protein P170DRAFT_505921 [Aspergillus steynii IBT 23096]PLB55317.1 hypothetical protein P170DRAFT_505921 [Aspergillus steynii IBT 23096]
MSGFRYSGTESTRITRELISQIAQLLDGARIPYVLWGESMMRALGTPAMPFSIDFVIGDGWHEKAHKVLRTAGFSHCAHGPSCVLKRPSERKPYPAAHLHLDAHRPLRLYAQTELLWEFPNLPLKRPAADDQYFMVTTDLRLPEQKEGCPPEYGRYDTSLYPVKVPHPTKLVEALILLICRDQHPSPHVLGFDRLWFLWFMHLLMYVGETGLLQPEKLEPHFMPVWEEACSDSFIEEPRLRAIKHLQATLWQQKALPPHRPNAPDS